MDYRDYRKKYGSSTQPRSTDNSSGFQDKKPAEPNGRQFGAQSRNESATGSVTRHFTAERKKRRKTQSKNSASAKIVLTAIIALTVFLVLMTALLIVTNDTLWLPDYIYPKIIVDAGRSSIKAADFLADKTHTAEFSEDTEYSLNHVGTYSIRLVVDGSKTVTTKLQVRDIVAPAATGANVTVRLGSMPRPELCVENITDATSVTVSFRTKPDLSELGTYKVSLLLKDEGGNESVVESTVTVVEDAAILNYTVTIEAGSRVPDVSAFVGIDGDGEYYSDVSLINTSVPGLYSPEVIVRAERYVVTIEVQDTVAPTATVTPKVIYNDGDFPDPSKFVSNIKDATEVVVTYAETPKKTGKYPIDVKIKLTDRGGNTAVYSTFVTSSTDHTAPDITVLSDVIEFSLGENYIWKSNIQVSDNSGETPDVSLDISQADVLTPGTYTVYYVAVDPAGNTARKQATMIVHDNLVTEEMYTEAIDKWMKSIIPNSGISELQKIQAVYAYMHQQIHGVIHYANDSPHDDWRREAYALLVSRNTGDCFAFASLGRAALEYLGYDTVIVERSASARQHGTHFWVMYNLGTEEAPLWYHFDATPMRSDVSIEAYALTTSQLNAYTLWRNDVLKDSTENYYVFDENDYPRSALTNLYTVSKIPASYYKNR